MYVAGDPWNSLQDSVHQFLKQGRRWGYTKWESHVAVETLVRVDGDIALGVLIQQHLQVSLG